MELYTPELTIAGILGFLVPILVAVLKQPKMSRTVTQIVVAVVSVLIALAAILVTGGFDKQGEIRDWGMLSLLVLGVTQAAYGLVWRQLNVVQKVEKNTNIGPKHLEGVPVFDDIGPNDDGYRDPSENADMTEADMAEVDDDPLF